MSNLETRRKHIIGEALLADAETNPDTKEFVQTVLARSTTSEADKAAITALLASGRSKP